MSIKAAVRENILAVADAYAKATGLSISTVSYRFHGQQAFLNDFRAGKCSIHLDKIDDMLQRFAKAWPKGTPKPKLKAIKMRFAADKNL
jgi:hypothetical protein